MTVVFWSGKVRNKRKRWMPGKENGTDGLCCVRRGSRFVNTAKQG
ncbi:MAG: hypothetical protein ACHQFX_02210 [Chitinophagales bacterium]